MDECFYIFFFHICKPIVSVLTCIRRVENDGKLFSNSKCKDISHVSQVSNEMSPN